MITLRVSFLFLFFCSQWADRFFCVIFPALLSISSPLCSYPFGETILEKTGVIQYLEVQWTRNWWSSAFRSPSCLVAPAAQWPQVSSNPSSTEAPAVQWPQLSGGSSCSVAPSCPVAVLQRVVWGPGSVLLDHEGLWFFECLHVVVASLCNLVTPICQTVRVAWLESGWGFWQCLGPISLRCLLDAILDLLLLQCQLQGTL